MSEQKVCPAGKVAPNPTTPIAKGGVKPQPYIGGRNEGYLNGEDQ